MVKSLSIILRSNAFSTLSAQAARDNEPIQAVCKFFNDTTNDGRNMYAYSELLSEAIRSMIEVKEEKDIDSLFSGGKTSALVHSIAGLDDFELIAFLVVQDVGGVNAVFLPPSGQIRQSYPKNKIYEHADARAALKEQFVAEVEKITWAYKLAPETINLGGCEAVPEIQVFQVQQRGDRLSEDVLRAMDRAIPFPILFELVSDAKRRTVAAFKRPNEGGKSKWVVSDYFWSDWQVDGGERASLPIARSVRTL